MISPEVSSLKQQAGTDKRLENVFTTAWDHFGENSIEKGSLTLTFFFFEANLILI